MANPRSDPEMGKDMEDLTKGLEELSDSPEDEKSERALLHSHLEQQHHLICILKEKSDDAHKCCRGLEQLNVELESLRTEGAVTMKSQTQLIQYLEKHFMDLAKNHEQMIQFKNQHRKQHTQLWEENKCLRQENEMLFSQAVRSSPYRRNVLTRVAEPRSEKRSCWKLRASKQVPNAWEVDSLEKQVQHLQEKHQQTLAWVEQAQSRQRARGSKLHTKLERMNEEKEQYKQREIQQHGKKLETAEQARQRARKCLVTGGGSSGQ